MSPLAIYSFDIQVMTPYLITVCCPLAIVMRAYKPIFPLQFIHNRQSIRSYSILNIFIFYSHILSLRSLSLSLSLTFALQIFPKKNSGNPNPIFLNNTELLRLSQNSLVKEKKYCINKTLKLSKKNERPKVNAPLLDLLASK